MTVVLEPASGVGQTTAGRIAHLTVPDALTLLALRGEPAERALPHHHRRRPSSR
ncbi:hypothetical protein ABTX81_16885 [Kitasatospora sp. NPDC097605]|uniref:hypothetical protein n=1 Tax=Kitasatospora sp. NPDC097605 TaxID=3157226 RepID=UPI0033217B5F